jgi:uncharacterized RDD family membrane protein YckC
MASADYTVLTPERVGLEYGIAGIGSRGAAAMVDTAIQTIALTVMLLALTGGTLVVGGLARQPAGGIALITAMFLLGAFIITSGYYIFFEIVWSGQTPGKRLVGLRVIRENGYPIRPVDAVIRNLVRLIDWLPVAYGIGLLVMLLNTRSRRVGDFASGTLVVREGARQTVPSLGHPVAPLGHPLAPLGHPLAPLGHPVAPLELSSLRPTSAASALPVSLSSADATLVRDFLARRATMDRKARGDLAQRLARTMSHRYRIPIEQAADDAEAFLERLSA